MTPDRFETIPKTGFAIQWDGTRRVAKKIAKWVDPEKSRFTNGNSVQYYEEMTLDGPRKELSINLPGCRVHLAPGDWLVAVDVDTDHGHYQTFTDEYFKETYRRPI